MSGNNILLDSNIIIYLLSGDNKLKSYFENKSFYISSINELEILGYKGISNEEAEALNYFLEECSVIELNPGIKKITIDIRQKFSIKLPDAIVAATAIFLNIPLISADRHFEKIPELTFILYQP